MAGQWDAWEGDNGEEVSSFLIISTDPNDVEKGYTTECRLSSSEVTMNSDFRIQGAMN